VVRDAPFSVADEANTHQPTPGGVPLYFVRLLEFGFIAAQKQQGQIANAIGRPFLI
jgi:hypothetical protein